MCTVMDNFIIELIDPETRENLMLRGEEELVITPLNDIAIPLIW